MNLKCVHSGQSGEHFQGGASSKLGVAHCSFQVVWLESLNPLVCTSTNQRRPESCLVSQLAEQI